MYDVESNFHSYFLFTFIAIKYYLTPKSFIMNDLIQKLQNDHGLDPAQAHGIINTIKDFIKEKFPMMAGAVDNLFPTETAAANTPTGDTGSTDGPAEKAEVF